MNWFATLLIVFFAAVSPATAQVDDGAKVQAQLIAESGTVAPGGIVTIAFVQEIRPGWHTYWLNPGDVGQPTTLVWSLPPGWKAGPLQWPYPKRLPVGSFMDYGYEGKVWILTHVTAPADAKPGAVTLKAAVSWLVCKEICIPEEATLTVSLTIGMPPGDAAKRLINNNATRSSFDEARTLLPLPSPWTMHYALTGHLDLFVAARSLATAHPRSAQFFPYAAGVVRGPAAQTMGFAPNGLVLRMTPTKGFARKGGALEGVLVLTSTDGSVQALQVTALPGPVPAAEFDTAESQIGLLFALVFAFIGGLILNLMPCVLPVLAMKAFALSSQAGRDRSEAVRESLAYGIGAILSFVGLGALLIALRAGGQAIGWGFQLQEPMIVAGFALLMFGVGLNLSGVFEVASFGVGEGLTRASGEVGSFFTGVLAVAVAAPCTAPFMAAALGYALTQPAIVSLFVFLALGLGFAAPFVVIGISPALMRALPKPGSWMLVFKQGLAFAMYGTAAWLVWVLALQAGANAVAFVLGAMVAAGFGAWIWGISRDFSPRGRGIGALATLIAVIVALSCLAFLNTSPAPANSSGVNITGLPSEPYSAERLSSLRSAKRPVFVNVTAAWCITCLVNDETALSSARVREAFQKKGIVYLVADWTRRDPEITKLLASYERSGVPLYLYYGPGAAPKILPQILTEGEVLAAIGP